MYGDYGANKGSDDDTTCGTENHPIMIYLCGSHAPAIIEYCWTHK